MRKPSDSSAAFGSSMPASDGTPNPATRGTPNPAPCLHADLARMLPRLRPHNLSKELLVRAARVRGAAGPLQAIDATAGLGDDSLLLAAAGFEVLMFERNPEVAAALRDGLARAAADPRLSTIVARMQLVEGDSIEALRVLANDLAADSTAQRPDVIYLDPMFPASKRKSAATKKKLQVIRQLELPCPDEDVLVHAALAVRSRKVVVKRPLKGSYLAGIKPSATLAGKVIRYDILVP